MKSIMDILAPKVLTSGYIDGTAGRESAGRLVVHVPALSYIREIPIDTAN